MEPRGARRDRRDRLGLAGPGSGAEFTRLARPTRSAAWSSRADASSASRSATWTGPRGGRSASRCASCTRRGTLRASHSRRAFLHDVRWRSTTVAGRRMSERVRGPSGSTCATRTCAGAAWLTWSTRGPPGAPRRRPERRPWTARCAICASGACMRSLARPGHADGGAVVRAPTDRRHPRQTPLAALDSTPAVGVRSLVGCALGDQ
jgi:hypothetical protein